MRALAIATLSICLASSSVGAKPSLYGQVTKFNDDRYASVAQGGMGPDVVKAIKKKTGAKARHPTKHKKPRKRPEPGTVAPLTMAGGFAREIGEALPQRFIRGRLICAVNVNAALAARGIRGTGSAYAKSFLAWGRASRPVPGAVAVWHRGKRGGHVAIVHSVKPSGQVIYLNPSSRRQTWVVGPYRRNPIAFRVAS